MTAAIYPPALWLPAGYTGLHPRQSIAAALLHTNGGPSSAGSLWGWWKQTAAAGSHIGAHYQVKSNGGVECYVDPALVIYHAYSASEWAIGIETQDDGNPNTPWTEAQVTSIAGILRYHRIPPVRLTSPSPASGVGFHREFTDWNGSGHYCPGSVREAQIPHVMALVGAPPTPSPTPTPTPIPKEDDVLVIMCSPGKHNPRLLPGGAGGKVGAEMSSATWSAYSDLAAAGGAKVVVMSTQEHYDAVVADLS